MDPRLKIIQISLPKFPKKCRHRYGSWRQTYLSVVMVEIIEGAPYRFADLGGIVLGYRFLRCLVSFCSGFNISLFIEQPSLLLYNNGNFDLGSWNWECSKPLFRNKYRHRCSFMHQMEVSGRLLRSTAC